MSEPMTSSAGGQGAEMRIRELEQKLQAAEVSLDKRFQELAKLTRSLEEERAQKETLQQQLHELREQAAHEEEQTAYEQRAASAASEPDAPAHDDPAYQAMELTDDDRARQLEYRQLVSQSELFDGAWYLEAYPDLQQVERYRQAPHDHYLLFGGFEGRDPGPEFDSSFYLEQYPDVARSKVNPLAHYLLYGRAENRQIKPA